jgi:hypothetical protein
MGDPNQVHLNLKGQQSNSYDAIVIGSGISGGGAYSIELTTKPQVDSRYLNEEHETTFINYLRIAMENCGFSRANVVEDLPEFVGYRSKVKPLLKPI